MTWDFLATATEAALQAGELQKARYGLQHEIQHKGEIDIVTEVDKSCEKAIVALIRERFPGHDIVTEETAIERTGSRYVWFVDPLDGTTNFAHGYPFFCASVALAVEGEVVAGALMVLEAGGRVTRFDGSPVGLRADQVVAAGAALHPRMLEVLVPDVARAAALRSS